MPDEYIIVSAAPVTVADIIMAAGGLDPECAIRGVAGYDTFQVCDRDGNPVATVMPSTVLASTADAETLLGIPLDTVGGGPVSWTEVFVPKRDALGTRLVSELTQHVGGSLHGEPRHHPVTR